ncbi:MAG TPA: type II toxin-antitoxin system VapC family toxin [Rhizomicrobium sp.]
MIVIDSSAIVAILRAEPAADALTKRIAKEPPGARLMSVASYLETGAVLAGRRKEKPLKAMDDLDGFLAEAGIDLADVDAEQAHTALRARIEYGRGFGASAGLNFGDCFSYALAKSRSAPLLYVGGDFDETDIVPALA